jgi:hypothetical protein
MENGIEEFEEAVVHGTESAEVRGIAAIDSVNPLVETTKSRKMRLNGEK